MPSESRDKRPLDPGPPRRKSGSCCTFLLVICASITALVVGILAFFLLKMLYGLATFSHANLFHPDRTSQLDYSAVVTPLIDDEHHFDIFATVWMTKPKGERQEWMPKQVKDGMVVDEGDGNESVLFSDVVFKGLRLRDKHVMADVPLRIPTALLREIPVYPYDLRATFVLIPASPSSLEHLESYSSWYPDKLRDMPRTLPKLSSFDSRGYSTSQANALESFAVHMPLLKLLEINSRCQDKQVPPDGDSTYTPPRPVLIRPSGGELWQSRNPFRRRRTALLNHPHVVTRTQLRIVEEAHFFNRTAYDDAHRSLRRTACTIPDTNSYFGRKFGQCVRQYETNGHWESRLTLSVPVMGEDGSMSNETRYAYAPYMNYLDAGDMSKDVIRVPVDREACDEDWPPSALPLGEDHMDVTWRLSFTGRTPSKFAMGDSLLPLTLGPHAVNITEYDALTNYHHNELMNGLFGHRFSQDAHPRRNLAILVLRTLLSFTSSVILDTHYWYTCSSTYSLSIVGTLMRALGQSINPVQLLAYEWNWDFASWAMLLPLVLMELLVSILMIKAALRLTFVWMGWLPVVRRAEPTHLERASVRIEARISWPVLVVTFGALVATHYVVKPHAVFVLPRTGPPQPMSFNNTKFITSPLFIVGNILQLLLNHRTGYYAGSYKVAVLLNVVVRLLDCIIYMPSLFGVPHRYPGLNLEEVLDIVVLAWSFWQVLTLQGRLQKGVDKDID